MIKRLIWFVSGVVAGISGVLFAGKRVKRSVTSFTPIKVAQRATQSTRSGLNSVADAFREGRDAMRDKEFEMKAKRDGRVESFDQIVARGPRVMQAITNASQISFVVVSIILSILKFQNTPLLVP